MTDNLIFGEPTFLKDVENPIAAGGYTENQPGEGGGGPTQGEMAIESIFLNYSSPSIGGDSWSSYHQNGAEFYDSDQNGYFDNLRRVDDNGIWTYNSDTGTWNYRAFSDSKNADNKIP